MTSPQLRAWIYLRASIDHHDDEATIRRHEKNCRKLCEQRGYEIAGVSIDNDTSAYSEKRRRPGFDELLDAVSKGQCDVVVVEHPDRLYRQPIDREAFLLLARSAGLTMIATVGKGDERIGHADDQFSGDLDVILARRESATIARRMRSKHASKRADGEWPGGPAPLGYRLDPENKTLVVDPANAELVREAVERFLQGESSLKVSAWLSDVSGRRWTPSNTLKLLTSPTLAGKRDDGSPAKWKPIVPPGDHEVLVALRRSRATGKRGPIGRYRLSGVMRCDACGHSMAAYSQRGRSGWRCSMPAGGCGAISIGDSLATEGLLDSLAEMLDSPEFRKALTQAMSEAPEIANAARTVADLRARLVMLEDALASGDLDLDGFRRVVPKVRIDLADAESVLTRSTGQGSIAAVPATGEALREAWPHLEPPEARALVGLLAEKVTVGPRIIGGPKSQTDRVKVVGRWVA
jgi:DNA invertase Pin-like site-specific DNA recombinase